MTKIIIKAYKDIFIWKNLIIELIEIIIVIIKKIIINAGVVTIEL